MKQKNKLLLLVFGLFVALFILKNSVQAENVLNYSVDPVLPKSMQEKGFYDFKHVKTNQTFKLSFYIKNYSNKKIKVVNEINDAHNSNGSIVYDRHKRKDAYKSINPKLSDLVVGSRKKVVTLKAHQKKKLTFKIKAPKSKIKGTILGGINSSEKIENDKINFSVSIALRNQSYPSNLEKLKIENFKPTKDQMKLSIINNQPEIVHNYKIKGQVLDSNEEIVKKFYSNYNMVPQSFTEYEMHYEDLKPGVYLMKLEISDNQGNQKKLNKYFKINGQVKKVKHKFDFKLILILVLTISIYISLILGVKKIRKSRWN